ncbi:helix-turn-helix domain-containing protein [Cohnella sp. GbtcB17]|uniref:helix-turn-helix transcriptional regulator n=1 Tax=Cohnella sp. GbtcB17 TaxID=2824762 RepID=UPI001C2F8527|nr:helix-turn-helix domain-containing protein [Cohnella sp. GbtcB17]
MTLTVRQARLLSDKTQQNMADMMDVHKQTYAKWEKHPDAMPVGKAKEFSAIVGLGVDEIFFDPCSTLSRKRGRKSTESSA